MVPFLTYSSLPESIPSHFNFNGDVKSWINKKIIFLFPAVGLAVFALLSFLEARPQLHNYPADLNEENAADYYAQSVNMLSWVKFISILMFLVVEFMIIDVAKTAFDNKYLWIILTLSVLLALIPLIRCLKKNPGRR